MKPPRNERETHAELLSRLTSESTAAQRMHDLHIPRRREPLASFFAGMWHFMAALAFAFAVVMLVGSMRPAVAVEPLKCGKGYAVEPMCATYEY